MVTHDSTKRNSKFALGKFGIGAKSALATGAPFFTVRTRYNGKTTAFNVYNASVEPITPKFNVATGEINSHFEMDTGRGVPMTVYYESTDMQNGVDIILQVKKHHRTQYIDAVKSQLMYFPEIKFTETHHDGTVIRHDTLAEIVYEDDAMIISNNAFHNKPHLLIDKVNYGNINFEELELQPHSGNIGLKMRSEQVSVNPSRESVIWDDITKQAILDSFNRVLEIASKRIEQELKEQDILKWYRACTNLTNGYKGTDPILHAMSRIVDFNAMKPAFSGNPKLNWSFPFNSFMRFTGITSTERYKGNRKVRALQRDSALYRRDIFGVRPIIRRQADTPSNARKNKYISRVLYPSGFVEMVMPDPVDAEYLEMVPSAGKYKYSLSRETKVSVLELLYGRKIPGLLWNIRDRQEEAIFKDFKSKEEDLLKQMHELADYVVDALGSHPDILNYEDIVVPAEFVATESEDTEDEEVAEVSQETQSLIKMKNEERRKLEGTILAHMPIHDFKVSDRKDENGNNLHTFFSKVKVEMKPSVVNDWNIKEVYFGTKVDEELLDMAALISAPVQEFPLEPSDKAEDFPVGKTEVCDKFLKDLKLDTSIREVTSPYGRIIPRKAILLLNSEIRFVMVSQDNAKHFEDFRHVKQFFMDIKENKLTMSEQLVRWNTARIMYPDLKKMMFLTNFSQINEDLSKWFVETYNEVLAAYNPRSVFGFGWKQEAVAQLGTYLDNVGMFQAFVRENPADAEGIAMMAKQMLNPAEGVTINDARAIDYSILDTFKEILDMSAPVRTLLNAMECLTGEGINEGRHVPSLIMSSDPTMSPELEHAVRVYIQEQGADRLFTYKIDQ